VASVSVSSLVLFIAALTVAVGVATTMSSSVADISDSLDDKSLAVSQAIDSDVEIISDAGSADAVYDDSTDELTLLVKNTGRSTQSDDPARIDVLVDGGYVPTADRSVEVVDGSVWSPGGVARVTVIRDLNAGDHRVVVIVAGDEDSFEFTT
jgi:flagellar protein FlaG